LTRGGQRVGRLVITVGGEPVVFPLNYAVDGEAIVFRTEVGTKLTGITRSLATFDADPDSLWERLAALDLDTWPGGHRPHVVRIRPYRVHGTAWTLVPATSGTTAVLA